MLKKCRRYNERLKYQRRTKRINNEMDNMCTGIKIKYDNGCFMGRTMDFQIPLNYNAIYLPRNYNFCNDLMGNPLY